MKNKVLLALFAAFLVLTGCNKDNDLLNRVENLETRVDALEQYCKELNELTIPGLTNLVAAIEGKLYINSVTSTESGYVIAFSNGTTAIISDGIDGEKGDKGDAPVVSFIAVDGIYYWAVNGEALRDAQGNMIAVTGNTPQLRINEGKWQVSYDKGASWTDVPQMGEAAGSTISIEDGESTVTFWINGEQYVIQKELPFSIKINVADRKNLAVIQGEEFFFEFSLEGMQPTDEIEVDFLNVPAGWEARVLLPEGSSEGYLGITNIDGSDAKIVVYAANGRGKTDMKALVFENGVFDAEMDAKAVPAEGGQILLTVVTNINYELYVAKNQKWLAEANTKAVHTDLITLEAQPNTTGGYRSAEVDLIFTDSDQTLQYFILQYPGSDQTTDLESLYQVENYTNVTLYKETVVAASQYSVVVSDGYSNLYVPYDYYPTGTVLNVSGFNSPDGFTPTNVEQVGEGGTVAETAYYYYSAGQSVSSVFASYNGKLELIEGAYALTTEFEDGAKEYVIVEAPLEDLGFDQMTEGNMVGVTGYVVGYMEGENGEDIYQMVVTRAHEAAFVEDGEIEAELTAAGDSFLWDNDGPYMAYGIYQKSVLDKITKEELIENFARTQADDYMFYVYLYGMFGMGTPETLAPQLLYSPGEAVSTSKPLANGEYIALAVALDEYGCILGDYGYLECTKDVEQPEAPELAANYEALFGYNSKYYYWAKSTTFAKEDLWNDGYDDWNYSVDGFASAFEEEGAFELEYALPGYYDTTNSEFRLATMYQFASYYVSDEDTSLLDNGFSVGDKLGVMLYITSGANADSDYVTFGVTTAEEDGSSILYEKSQGDLQAVVYSGNSLLLYFPAKVTVTQFQEITADAAAPKLTVSMDSKDIKWQPIEGNVTFDATKVAKKNMRVNAKTSNSNKELPSKKISLNSKVPARSARVIE